VKRTRAGAERLLAGVGDRLWWHESGETVFLPEEARRLGLPTDLFEIWLPRGWRASWIPQRDLRRLSRAGTIPVVVEYFFRDGISRERVVREREAWHRSLRRLANVVAIDAPVLVVLVPEFNDEPPHGETAITDWAGFSNEIASALAIFRERAPNARVGVCAGDFSPDRDLALPLGGISSQLDFLAFQEMRAVTEPSSNRPGYLSLGKAALEYARYLQDEFRLPVLLAYVAVSSHGRWNIRQRDALLDLARQREALRRAGVFGAIYFQSRDDPRASGYFREAERGFGLNRADGGEKPALRAWRRMSGDSAGRRAQSRAPAFR
jgi:hypothetical protein